MNEIEDVMKNIINIDNSASELKNNIGNQLKQQKEEVGKEIDNLRKNIITDYEKELIAVKEKEIKNADEESREVSERSNAICKQMEEKFQNKKEDFIKETFKEIIK